MNKKIYFFGACAWALFMVAPAHAAELVTTGSQQADVILQWLTTIVTAATLLSNFIPTPQAAQGSRVLSVIVNLLAGNWKHILDAWNGTPTTADATGTGGGSTLPSFFAAALGVLLLAALVAPNANAVTAPTPTVSVVKAGFSWIYPTTRTDGSTLALSQIKQINLYVSSLAAVIVVPAPATSYSYVLPAGVCIKTTDIAQATATDTDGLESAASDKATIAGDICGPKPPPAPPSGVKVTLVSSAG